MGGEASQPGCLFGVTLRATGVAGGPKECRGPRGSEHRDHGFQESEVTKFVILKFGKKTKFRKLPSSNAPCVLPSNVTALLQTNINLKKLLNYLN